MSPQDHANLPATIPNNGVETYRMSTDAAQICGAIVKATAQNIQGRNYVKVEGWQAIAVAHGCAASSLGVERVEGGVRAVGQVRRMDTGGVVAEAEGFVGEDEPVWFGGETTDKWGKKKVHPKRSDFAIRAMAQTRAISRACRSAFAHVVVMIDKDLSTTPAEEMQGVYENSNGGDPPQDWVDDARKDGLVKNGETRSQYQVDKVKKAVENGWRVTNTTAKGKLDQLYAYIDMARNPDDVAAILNSNIQEIANSGEREKIAEAADTLLRWFEKNAAPSLQ
jgi:hypothetical protein